MPLSQSIIDAPWLRLNLFMPWGAPKFSGLAIGAIAAGFFCVMIESIGDYHNCSYAAGINDPTVPQINRGIGAEGMCCALSGLLGYYEESYLVFELGEFSRSLSENARSASKVYAVDPGMLTAFSPSAVRDEGQRLETAVFDRLRRGAGGMREGAISRLVVDDGGRHEVDFVVGDALLGGGYRLVQVSVSMAERATREREVAGLRGERREVRPLSDRLDPLRARPGRVRFLLA